MGKSIWRGWAAAAVGASMLLLLAVACGETVVKEIPVEKIVEKEVVREVPVEVEKVVEVEREVVKEVVREVPVEVVKEVEVIKEVPKVITEEKVVVREVEKVVVATPVPAGQEPFLLKTLDPFPKRGGQLILAAHGPPAHFDLLQAGSVANIGSMGAMFDGLLRRDPRTPLIPVVPDLASRWEISPDGLTYTFTLREGVKFHDGDEMDSSDVKASWDRILFPREGVLSQRLPSVDIINEVNALDDYTVEFKMSGPRALDAMMIAFAMQWHVILQKEFLEANNDNLREIDNYPGTGPFVYGSRDDSQWIQNANPDYWNPNAPYVDSIKHVWLRARTPENTAALLGGITDWNMWIAPKDGKNIGDKVGINAITMHMPVVHGVMFNTQRTPFDDARVRRALMLVIDQQAMLKAIEDVKALGFGDMFLDGTPFALSTEQLQQIPGFRKPTPEDIADAQKLLADAGYPNGEGIGALDLLTRDDPPIRIYSNAIQGMLKQHLNVDTEIRLIDVSGFYEDARQGKFDIFPEGGTSGAVPDPSIYLTAILGSDGPSNFGKWENAEFKRALGRSLQRAGHAEASRHRQPAA